jgi:hypothetical protein
MAMDDFVGWQLQTAKPADVRPCLRCTVTIVYMDDANKRDDAHDDDDKISHILRVDVRFLS